MKIYLALAAVIVCVLAMGITSMGGPERIVRMMTQNVGDREVDQVDSNHADKENKVIKGEDEEEAYQEIRDIYKTDVVKLSLNVKGMKFDSMNLDQNNQIIEMYYLYDNETVGYIINMPYRESSLGIDFEDTAEEEYYIEVKNCKIDITRYEANKNGVPRWGARFKYDGIEYLLTGTMKQENFEKLLKNLVFPK